tara:strand:+ start:62 stop:238 length:177 start_codon:yes stop_codon:yes gene_type:complete
MPLLLARRTPVCTHTVKDKEEKGKSWRAEKDTLLYIYTILFLIYIRTEKLASAYESTT